MMNFFIGLFLGAFITALSASGTISDLRLEIMYLKNKLRQADKK